MEIFCTKSVGTLLYIMIQIFCSLQMDGKAHLALLIPPFSILPFSDPLAGHPDVRPEPVFGPSIQFAGKLARWTGDAHSLAGQMGCEARIAMEAYAGQRTTAYLEVINDGTTAIYYDWKVGSTLCYLSFLVVVLS